MSWYRAQGAEEQSQPEYRYTLVRSLELLSQYAQARLLIQGLAAEGPGNVDYQGVLGLLAARRGDRAEAQRIDLRLAGLSRPYLRGFPHTTARRSRPCSVTATARSSSSGTPSPRARWIRGTTCIPSRASPPCTPMKRRC